MKVNQGVENYEFQKYLKRTINYMQLHYLGREKLNLFNYLNM